MKKTQILLPIFHAALTGINIYLLIFNYKQDYYLDAIIHTLFALNFAIMFLVTSEEIVSGDKPDNME